MVNWKEPMEIYFDEELRAKEQRLKDGNPDITARRDVELINDPELQELIAVKLTMIKCLGGKKPLEDPAVFLFNQDGTLNSNSLFPNGLKFVKLRNKECFRKWELRVKGEYGYKTLSEACFSKEEAAVRFYHKLTDEEKLWFVRCQILEVLHE